MISSHGQEKGEKKKTAYSTGKKKVEEILTAKFWIGTAHDRRGEGEFLENGALENFLGGGTGGGIRSKNMNRNSRGGAVSNTVGERKGEKKP